MGYHKFVMRQVIEIGIPYHYKIKSLSGQVAQRKQRKLSCGHLIWEHDPSALADKLRCVFQLIAFNKGEKIMARCYECGRNKK